MTTKASKKKAKKVKAIDWTIVNIQQDLISLKSLERLNRGDMVGSFLKLLEQPEELVRGLRETPLTNKIKRLTP